MPLEDRLAPVPMRLPPLGGSQWAAIAVSQGIYPDTHYDIYYFLVVSGSNVSSHAFNFAQDFGLDHRGIDYHVNIPAPAAINIGPTYLWDGTTLHSYGNTLFGSGSLPAAVTPVPLGVSFSLFSRVFGIGVPVPIIGRKFRSPIRIAHLSGGRLTTAGISVWTNIGNHLWNNHLVSEGVEYVPAVLSDKWSVLLPIDSWRLVTRACTLHRRTRSGIGMARIIFPTAFPTPSG